MKIYLCRHGETVFNAERRWQGRVDSALTEKGTSQARENAEYLADKKIDAIFSSPLGRARKTASFLRERLPKLPYFEKSVLKEINNGEADGLTFEESRKRFPQLLKRIRLEDFDSAFPGGESYRDLIARLKPFAERLKKEFGKKTVAVIAHSGVNRMLVKIFLSLPDEKIAGLSAPNDLIYEITLLGGKAQVHHIRSGERKEGLVFRA